MSRKLANLAGVGATLILIIRMTLDFDGADGGWHMPPTLMSASNCFFCVFAVCWAADRVVDSAFTRRHNLMRQLVREAMADEIGEAIREFGEQQFRAGMVVGAAQVAAPRPHLIHQGGSDGRR